MLRILRLHAGHWLWLALLGSCLSAVGKVGPLPVPLNGLPPSGATAGVDNNAGSPGADADWAKLEAAENQLPYYASLEAFQRRTVTEALPIQEKVQQAIFAAADNFYTSHPKDRRRLEAVKRYLDLSALAHFYVRTPTQAEMPAPDIAKKMTTRDWNRWYATTPAIKSDEMARRDWLERGEQMVAETLSTSGLSTAEREDLAFALIHRDLAQLRAVVLSEEPKDWRRSLEAIGDRVIQHIRQYESPDMGGRTSTYMGYYVNLVRYLQRYKIVEREEGNHAIRHQWKRFLESSNESVRMTVEKEIAELIAREKAGIDDINFVALDGRKFEVREKRGNVLLIDFWAMWCRPCVDELPLLKRLYQQYNGFSIVGINCDLESQKERLEKFLKDNGYDWPQHFDGMGTANEFAKLFSVSAWPTTILVGRDGEIIETNLRGERLEAAVRKALGMEPK